MQSAYKWFLAAIVIVAPACAPEDDVEEPPRETSPPPQPTPAKEPETVVKSVSPAAGPYGTEIDVRGDNLEAFGLVSPAPDGSDVVLGGLGWEGGRARVPFPATGELFIVSEDDPKDRRPAGRFTSTWTPGAPLAGITQQGKAYELGGELVLVSHGDGQSIHFDVLGAQPRRATVVTQIEPPTTRETFADLRETSRVAGDRIEMLITTSKRVELITFDGTTAAMTGFDAPAEPILGIGFDEAGFVIAARPSEGFVQRYRAASPPALAAIGDPVATPAQGKADELVCDVAGATIICVRGYDVHSFFDDYAVFQMSALAPADTTFGEWVGLGGGDDHVHSVETSEINGVLQIRTCVTDMGFHAPKTSCATRITFDGKRAIRDEGVYRIAGDYSTGTLAYATCDDDGVLSLRWGLGPSTIAAKAEEIADPALYPCNQNAFHVEGILPSADGGAPRLVVATLNDDFSVKATYVASRQVP